MYNYFKINFLTKINIHKCLLTLHPQVPEQAERADVHVKMEKILFRINLIGGGIDLHVFF